jgi:hypothetical protein
MVLKTVKWTRKNMEVVQWQVKSHRCPLVVTEDMVWKTLIVNVIERWQWKDIPLMFMLLEDI